MCVHESCMPLQLHGNNYWHSHDQACFQVERSVSRVKKLCTLLHRELRDYSLGQIAFGVFECYCYHTAALPCKRVVNKRL